MKKVTSFIQRHTFDIVVGLLIVLISSNALLFIKMLSLQQEVQNSKLNLYSIEARLDTLNRYGKSTNDLDDLRTEIYSITEQLDDIESDIIDLKYNY